MASLGGSSVEELDDIGVELFERNEGKVVCAKGGLEAAAIFEDVFFAVPCCETETQYILAGEFADAARTGAEAMDKPGELRKGSNLENSQAAHFAFGPIVRGGSAATLFADTVLCPECFRKCHNSTSIIGLECLASAGDLEAS